MNALSIGSYAPVIYVPEQERRQSSGTLEDMYRVWPEWRTAMDIAKQCMVSLKMEIFISAQILFF